MRRLDTHIERGELPVRKTGSDIFVFFCVILVFSLLLASCDMFTSRDPESPVAPRTDYTAASTPEILMDNFRNSFKDRITENYLVCFVDSSFTSRKYSYTASAGSVLTYPHLLYWNLQAERQYFVNLVNALQSESAISLTYSNLTVNYYSDSASVSAAYSLSVPFKDESRPKYYQGSLKFTLVRDQRLQWAISYWQDIKDQKYPSWSELKGSLY